MIAVGASGHVPSLPLRSRSLAQAERPQLYHLRAPVDWLQSEMKVGKVSQKLEGLIGLTVEELAAEVKKQRPGKQGLSVAELKRVKDEHAANVVPPASPRPRS